MQFNDQYVSSSVDVARDEKEFVEMQDTDIPDPAAKKGKALCRFGFPIPPMPKTVLLEPYEGDDTDNLTKLHNKIKNELDEMKDGPCHLMNSSIKLTVLLMNTF